MLKDEEQTVRFVRELAKVLKGDEIICLSGPLGAGKTFIVRALVQALGLYEGYQVRSPTFTLINEYPTEKFRVFHVDLYRVKDLNLDEFLGNGLVLIEWPTPDIPCDLWIEIEILPEGRKLRIRPCSEKGSYAYSKLSDYRSERHL
ncbi:tRNA (adenosine(37)-N6)-threonylcarbamoyltransferase complex ATPase subunit type 1 TsaE [Thermocrinis minervae]|uniref:tRNA (adenosine(37)-N6)-threonylcarbamoyltransferase complex ATPase subunit type 1 TsaE n=1 Tax=Thermocrinis minervae TaxID=381751 RepID=UPI001E367307|nr:tRNA (adenosine(37)-N6)-threonylcarbamoyltransferase complex ATPase subunit type 1 TsaE [Thermocrinis minervae]